MKRFALLKVLLLLVSLLIIPSSRLLAQKFDKPNGFILLQDGEEYQITPVEGTLDVVTFYDYYSDSGHTPFMEDQTSRIYLYRDTVAEELSLVIHHAVDEGALNSYRVKMNLQGVPEEAYTALSDEPGEFDLGKEPERNWSHTHNSDGGIVGGLPTDEDWSITVTPDLFSGISKWQCLTGTAFLGVESIGLDMEGQITISTPKARSSGGNGCFYSYSSPRFVRA